MALNTLENDVGYIDVTKEWLGPKPKKNNIVKKYKLGETYLYKKHKYIVDNHYVKYLFNEGEVEFANWLATKTSKQITLMPKIEYPMNIKSPDFKIENEYYDLKTIYGNSKQVIYHKIYNKSNQAKCFFINVNKHCELSIDELIKQANKIFLRTDTNWVKIIGIRKNNKIIILKNKTKS